MKLMFISLAAAITCASSLVIAQQQKPAPPGPPAAAELEYDTYCKKTQQEKRALFRAGTPDQKNLIARRQVERWRDANRAKLSKEQLTLLGDFVAIITPALFSGDKDAQAKLEAVGKRMEEAFTSAQIDEMDRDGPCMPKVVKDNPIS